jgi:hypothetical protein
VAAGWKFHWRLHIERERPESAQDGGNSPRLMHYALVGLAVIGIIGVVLWRVYSG